MDSVVRLMVGKMEMQPLGSAITYARRYARKALFGMVDVDDDGKGQQPAKKAEAEPVQPFDLIDEAIAELASVGTVADLGSWTERVRMSGFTGADREQGLAARSEKLRALKDKEGK